MNDDKERDIPNDKCITWPIQDTQILGKKDNLVCQRFDTSNNIVPSFYQKLKWYIKTEECKNPTNMQCKNNQFVRTHKWIFSEVCEIQKFPALQSYGWKDVKKFRKKDNFVCQKFDMSIIVSILYQKLSWSI